MNTFAAISDMIKRAETHADETSADRLRAIEYYEGKMVDTPSDAGRSQMVSRDVRAQIKKVLPSLMRTILGSDEVVEFLPVDEGDEEGAEQGSDYINYVVLPESDARSAIYDAIHDALLLRNGVLKWWYDEKQAVKISKHSGLTEAALADLINDDDVEVLEQSETPETIVIDEQEIEIALYSVKIRRTYIEKEIRCAAVPRERFLIHPDAVTLQDSLVTGEKTTITRSDLVAMGYDRETINGLSVAADDEIEQDARRDMTNADGGEAQRANDALDFYDVYLRVDMDDDGISELRHMTFAGGLTEKHLLENEEVDEIQFCDICAMRQPHQWEGISLADDLMDIQRVKSVLLRQTLDNLYWQNNPQPIMQDGAIVDEDAVYNPEFGKPIVIAKGFDVRQAMGFNSVPFVARDSFGMLEYIDSEAQDRTGVSDASSGLAPDALQNMTAKGAAMIEQAGIGQTEMMVRNVADGLRVFFRGLLRLSIRHQDVPRTVRLRGEWVEVDPRHWNAEMDCAVNTGLGAGTRERDMQMMQAVMAIQEKLIAGFGPDNPFVKPENLHKTLVKLAESAGLKTPSLYFTEPDPEQIKAQAEAQAKQPDPEQMKIQAQMQLEQAKMQMAAEQAKAQIQIDQNREQEQMRADLQVKQAEIQAEQQKQADKLASDAALQERDLAFKAQVHRDEMAMRRDEAATARQDEIWKAQASAFNPVVEAAE